VRFRCAKGVEFGACFALKIAHETAPKSTPSDAVSGVGNRPEIAGSNVDFDTVLRAGLRVSNAQKYALLDVNRRASGACFARKNAHEKRRQKATENAHKRRGFCAGKEAHFASFFARKYAPESAVRHGS
jgi:hypothetical protein